MTRGAFTGSAAGPELNSEARDGPRKMVSRFFDSVELYWPELMLEAALSTALDTGDAAVSEWESAFADHVGARDAVFLPSGRAAITSALGFAEAAGRDVILPAFLCPAVAHAVIAAGARPVLVDCDIPNGSISISQTIASLSDRTAAVIAPHLFGIPTPLDELKGILADRNVLLIEDCAHTLGAVCDGVPVGAVGDFAIYSFNHDKPLSLLGGGMLTTSQSNGKTAFAGWRTKRAAISPSVERIEVMAWRDWKNERIRQPASPPRNSPVPGRPPSTFLDGFTIPRYETQPSAVGSLRAALGLAVLSSYSDALLARNRNATYLIDRLAPLGFVPPEIRKNCSPAFLKLNLLCPEDLIESIDDIAECLCEYGYRSGRFNWPLGLQDRKELAGDLAVRGALVNAPGMAARSLNLPINPGMSEDDLDGIAAVVTECVELARNETTS